MIEFTEDIKEEVLMSVAKKMVAAAITAPKASGQDKVVASIVTGKEKDEISKKMLKLGQMYDQAFIIRDSKCLKNSYCAVLIGMKKQPYGMNNCSFCGFPTCRDTMNAGANCALNLTDLGIAIGSAVSIASDNRIDNRVMYSIGKAVTKMNIMPDDVTVCYGIPLSISSKSGFFDRAPGAILSTN